jgi:hypothetical protein
MLSYTHFMARVMESVARQAVTGDGDDDAVGQEGLRNPAVVGTVALAKSAAMQEEEHGRIGYLAFRQVQIQPLLRVVAVSKVEMVRISTAQVGRARVHGLVELLPIDCELIRVHHGVILRRVLRHSFRKRIRQRHSGADHQAAQDGSFESSHE